MNNEIRFADRVVALRQFVDREGHCRVPARHVEVLEGKEIKLGSFVSYQRQRRRRLEDAICHSTDTSASSRLSQTYDKFVERKEVLETVPGWEWGPLHPGPAGKKTRNNEIRVAYGSGTTARELAQRFGLSRQRIHQLVGPSVAGT